MTQLTKLPPGVQVETLKVGTEDVQIFTYLNGRYRLWPDDLTAKWRWALRQWPDDDLSIPAHGSANTIFAAMRKCQEHRDLRAAAEANR